MRRLLVLVACFASGAVRAGGLTVPADFGIGPEAVWFLGRVQADRGAVPHFALAFNLEAVIDRAFIQANRDRLPVKYRAVADRLTEVRVSPSIFIPSRLYVSPRIPGLGAAGLYGVGWNPIGLTLLRTAPSSGRPGGGASVDASLLLTYLFIHSDSPAIPTTHFLRPGLELKATVAVRLAERLWVSLGGGAQVYVPQRLGAFLEIVPLDESLWLAAFAFLKLHLRFPYQLGA